jgi:hydrogenase maturation protease
VSWDALGGRAPRTVQVGGVHVGRGSLVRLRPSAERRADVFDRALAGRTALVESLHQELDGAVQLAVVLEDDPGRDLGVARQPGHRFFFAAEEVEPLDEGVAPAQCSVLVAGIGNVLMADDGFGVEVARLLAQRELPRGVKVGDYGIRGIDLAYELNEDYDAAMLIDTVARGEAPGTLFVIEPDLEEEAAAGAGALDPHRMDPVRVLGLARAMGPLPPRLLVVGCEPAVLPDPDDEELAMGLSEPVQRAARVAVGLVESLLDELLRADDEEQPGEEAGR